MQEVFRLLEHVLTPQFGPSYPLDKVKEALREAQSPTQGGGKVFLTS